MFIPIDVLIHDQRKVSNYSVSEFIPGLNIEDLFNQGHISEAEHLSLCKSILSFKPELRAMLGDHGIKGVGLDPQNFKIFQDNDLMICTDIGAQITGFYRFDD